MFLVFEGIDGSGKETQVKLLVERLRRMGKKVELLDFPDYESKPGKKIGQWLNHEIELSNEELGRLFAEDRKLAMPKLKKWLKEGRTVIADRYAYSNLAYQLAKGVDYNYLYSLDKELVFPDAVFFIDTAIDEVIKRMDASRKRDKHELNKELQEKTAENYRRMCSGEIRVFGNAKWIRINGNRTIDEIRKQIWQYVEACLSG